MAKNWSQLPVRLGVYMRSGMSVCVSVFEHKYAHHDVSACLSCDITI